VIGRSSPLKWWRRLADGLLYVGARLPISRSFAQGESTDAAPSVLNRFSAGEHRSLREDLGSFGEPRPTM
jgi:hypothetical protein